METLIKGEPFEYDDNSFNELTNQLNQNQESTFIESQFQAEQFYLNNIQNVLNGKCDEDYEFLIDLIKMNKSSTDLSADEHHFEHELINPKDLRQPSLATHSNDKTLTANSHQLNMNKKILHLKPFESVSKMTSLDSSRAVYQISGGEVEPASNISIPLPATELMNSEFFFQDENEDECMHNFNAHIVDAQDIISQNLDLFKVVQSGEPTQSKPIEKPAEFQEFTANTGYIQLDYLNQMKTDEEKQIHSRLWFTTRRGFRTFNSNTACSDDAGWGCMIRSGQMMIAQGLLMHVFGKEWSLYHKFKLNEYNLYKNVLALFNDRPSKQCPLGIHSLIEVADQRLHASGENSVIAQNLSTTQVGNWFDAESVCYLMKQALDDAADTNVLLNQLRIYVASDSTIYKQDVIDLCTEQASEGGMDTSEFKPCILLIPVCLGSEELNEIFKPSLKLFLDMKTCIGMIGGKAKQAFYFIGCQGILIEDLI